jgi:hypothetical protein
MLRVELARDKRDQPRTPPAEPPPRVLELPPGADSVSMLQLPARGGEVVQAAKEVVVAAEPEALGKRACCLRILAAFEVALCAPDDRAKTRLRRRPLLVL